MHVTMGQELKIKFTDAVKDMVCRILQTCSAVLAKSRKKKHVLFVCHGPVMAEYLQPVYEVIRDDPRLTFRLALPPQQRWKGSYDYIDKKLQIHKIHFRVAVIKKWDLILLANHGTGRLVDGKRSCAIYFNHGVSSGKLVNGSHYSVSPQGTLDAEGRPIYRRICLSSSHAVEMESKSNPAIKSCLAVTGSHKIDGLLDARGQRESIRQSKGIVSADKVVLLFSTWGDNCLLERAGEKLLAKMVELKDRYRFVLTCHPNNYNERYDGRESWGERLKGYEKYDFKVLQAAEDFDPYLLAADIVVTDHTSACCYAAILDKPAVFMDIPKGILDSSSVIYKYMEISPVLNEECSNLAECLMSASDNYPLDDLKSIKNCICDCPGEHNERVGSLLYSLLNIPAPRAPE